ncbi:hypothetical protein Q8A67_018717 [Cirrhinus molitorella]|uniref:Uncharacterized protein n=1 Tax=Cirrhinus molitorella TaxID=172907 RepID=A0AA88PGK9_9TELE|nr:hypothetical protein Q8A67_018717 [Cirrhinus molitorella]
MRRERIPDASKQKFTKQKTHNKKYMEWRSRGVTGEGKVGQDHGVEEGQANEVEQVTKEQAEQDSRAEQAEWGARADQAAMVELEQ